MNQAKRAFAPKIGLSTMLLLVAALVAGLSSWRLDQSIERARLEVYPLRHLSNELRVQRPDEYVVVGHFPTRYDELIYTVHVPDDGDHELCLALDKIPLKALVEPLKRVAISPGIHQVELKYELSDSESVVKVLLDDQQSITVTRPKDWESRLDSDGGIRYRESMHFPAGRPLTLVRKKFSEWADSKGKTGVRDVGPGVLLWVQHAQVEQ